MKIIVAPDSFKGSMTSIEAAESIQKGLLSVDPQLELTLIPMADGGEGTVDAILHILKGEKRTVLVHDPLGRPVEAEFGWVPSEKTAVIEVAAASGLPLLKKEELNPFEASTHGTGELILEALDLGAEKIIFGLGGSATVDAGAGCFQALGARFYDTNGQEVRASGGSLQKIDRVDASSLDTRLREVEFIIASDVTNPLLGTEGAVAVFGPQKGIKPEELEEFEWGMRHYAEKIASSTGHDARDSDGSGAAGGFGFSLYSFLNPTFRSGFELISELSGLDAQLSEAQLVITGEGKLDSQSLYGKVPVGMAQHAQKYGVPTVAFAGKIEGDGRGTGLDAIVPIVDEPMSLEAAMANGRQLLQQASARFFKVASLFDQ